MQPEDLLPRLIEAVVHPLPTRSCDQAPVQDNVITSRINLRELFPVCTYNALDSGAYYVSGVMVVKGADGQKRYTSIRRMQLLDGNRTSILISSPELFQQYREFEERGEPMEAAFMFGIVPAVVLASQVSTHLFHADKLEVASALLGQPLAVVRCKTIDLEVLAEAEVVFEGRILPGSANRKVRSASSAVTTARAPSSRSSNSLLSPTGTIRSGRPFSRPAMRRSCRWRLHVRLPCWAPSARSSPVSKMFTSPWAASGVIMRSSASGRCRKATAKPPF